MCCKLLNICRPDSAVGRKRERDFCNRKVKLILYLYLSRATAVTVVGPAADRCQATDNGTFTKLFFFKWERQGKYFSPRDKDNNWEWQTDGQMDRMLLYVLGPSRLHMPPLASTRWHNKNSNKFNATQQALGMTLGHVTASERGRGTFQGASLGVALLPLFAFVVCVRQSVCVRVSVCGKVETFDICVCQHALLIRRMAGQNVNKFRGK